MIFINFFCAIQCVGPKHAKIIIFLVIDPLHTTVAYVVGGCIKNPIARFTEFLMKLWREETVTI